MRWTPGLIVLTAVLAGCAAAPPTVADRAPDPDCAAFEPYGELTGRAVSVLVPDDARAFAAAAEPFEACTGAVVRYEGGAGSVEAQLRSRLVAGNPPDVAHLPGPALLASLVRDPAPGARFVVPAPPQVTVNVDQYFPETYRVAGSVGGTLYATPLDARVVTGVRWSPRGLEEAGLDAPRTREELVALVEDRADGGEPVLCPFPPTPPSSVLEGAVLAGAGPDLHDAWVEHSVAADDERVADALAAIDPLRDPDAVAPAGSTLLDGTCLVEHPARDQPVWPVGTEIGPDGDVWAAPLPADEPGGPLSVLAEGSFAAAFDDRPEVAAFQAYLSSPVWADAVARATVDRPAGWSTAHAAADASLIEDALDRRTAEILQDPATTVRFDGAQLVPPPVAAALADAAARWASGAPGAEVLAPVEEAWPTG